MTKFPGILLEICLDGPEPLAPADLEALARAMRSAAVSGVVVYAADVEPEPALVTICEIRRVALGAAAFTLVADGGAGSRIWRAADGAIVPWPPACGDEIEAMRAEGKILVAGCGRSQRVAVEAWEAGVDLIYYQPFFPTATGDVEAGLADPELLHWWAEMMPTPVLAGGGVSTANVEELLWSGAHLVLVPWRSATAGRGEPGPYDELIVRYRT